MLLPQPEDPKKRNLESEIIRLRTRVNEIEREIGDRFQGFVYASTPSTVTIASSATYVDLAVTGTLADVSEGSEALSGKLGIKNSSNRTRLVRVQATYDAASTGAGAELRLRLVKNGSAITGAECAASTTAAGVIAKLHSFALVRVDPGDEIWMQAANWTNSNNISFVRGRIEWHRLWGIV
jgi:hypothetical protein